MSSIHSSGATAIRPAKSLAGIVWRFRGIVLPLALISGVINLLYLSGSLFMLEVYDRVMPSRSIPTLVGLLLFLAVLFGFQAVLEIVRSRVLVRLGSAATTGLGSKAFALGVKSAVTGSSGASAKHLQDVEQLRRFLSGPGPTALFDLPWMPIYLGLCFVFHPLIGIVASVGALVLVSLTVLSDRLTEYYARTGRSPSLRRDETADMARRNAEVVIAMGMLERISARWERAGGAALCEMQRGADVTATLGALSKIMRMALQSLVLAVGAYLAIMGEASSGIMIASSILTARALAPVEQAIANWRGLVSARQSWRDLMQCLPKAQAQAARVALPAPRRSLSVEHLSSAPAKDLPPIIRDVSFKLDCGDGLGIVGRSGSGKSSLLRSLLGVWAVSQGSIRLDGATIDQWPDTIRGAHFGYLPQDIELFAGTVAENISRFDEEAESTAVIAAARQADIHELILSLPNGYETEVGERGAALSAGQRQRIALARALYGNPFLVVLDEPNSNLDAEGEVALNATIKRVRERGGIVIVVAHRPSALAELNLVMVMNAGQVHDFGPKDEVLGRLTRPTASAGSVTSSSRGNLIDRMAS